MRSYIRSTGSYRQSGGQDVPCSVHISVMRRAAPARPGPDVQRDLRRQGSACGTHPAAGEPAVDDDEVTPVPGALVLQHGAQFRPRSVGDGARERAVLQHIADGQVLDHDRLVLADESSGELVEKVVPAIGDPCMDPGHLASALVVIAGTSGLAGELSLGPREAGSVPALVSGIGDLLSRGEGDEGGDSHVDADREISVGSRGNRVFAQHGHEPSSRTVAGHRHRRRLCPRRQGRDQRMSSGVVILASVR